jgi:hypothetical protein
LKVSVLKFWIGRSWSKGCFSGGISAIKNCAERFLFKTKQPSPAIVQEDTIQIANEEIAGSPLLTTPASASQNHFAGFFRKENIEEEDLSYEIFKQNLEKETEQFKAYLIQNNFKNIYEIKSTAAFWIKNIAKYPLLSKLAKIILNIKSSSSCIERYFSICGFTSKKNSANIGYDLFISRCLLRANIGILKELNEIAY